MSFASLFHCSSAYRFHICHATSDTARKYEIIDNPGESLRRNAAFDDVSPAVVGNTYPWCSFKKADTNAKHDEKARQSRAHLQILHGALEVVVVVVPARRLHVEDVVVERAQAVDLPLEGVLDREETLFDR